MQNGNWNGIIVVLFIACPGDWTVRTLLLHHVLDFSLLVVQLLMWIIMHHV